MQYSKAKIIEDIKKLKQKGEPRNTCYMLKHQRKLINAAKKPRYFGSWKNAIEATGEDYSLIKIRDFYREEIWTDDLIKYEVLRLSNEKVDLNPGHMRKVYPAFFEYTRNKKGSWKAVIELAGLDYKEIVHNNHLSEEEKLLLFFDYLWMDGRRGALGELAKKYSIGLSTTKRHISNMSKIYLDNSKVSVDFQKRFYNYIVEETKKRGRIDKISDLERKILSNCGYEIVKEDTTIFLRRK